MIRFFGYNSTESIGHSKMKYVKQLNWFRRKIYANKERCNLQMQEQFADKLCINCDETVSRTNGIIICVYLCTTNRMPPSSTFKLKQVSLTFNAFELALFSLYSFYAVADSAYSEYVNRLFAPSISSQVSSQQFILSFAHKHTTWCILW